MLHTAKRAPSFFTQPQPVADVAALCHGSPMAVTLHPISVTKLMFGALAVAGTVGGFAPPASACRAPYRFDPATEVHEVVVVAVALRRDDWGRFSYDTGVPIDRETGEPAGNAYNREWVAELRTLWSLKGEAVPIIQVSPDEALIATSDGETIIVGGCGDGIETPQPGKTYAVYMDRRDGVLKATRLVDIAFAQRADPLFTSASVIRDR